MSARRLCIALTTLTLGCGSVHAQSFTDGDVYIMTSHWPGVGGAVARVDPVTGATDVLHAFETYPASAAATYDPWRDRILIEPELASGIMRFIAADGSYTDIGGLPGHKAYCPTGDGRVYLLSGLARITYFDASDVLRTLYDVDGVTPFVVSEGVMAREEMIYDAGTNSLFIAHWGAEATQVTKIPLSADGTQVAAPPTTVEYDGFEDEQDEPAGISAGPNGTIFIKIRAASNDAGTLMFLIDPVTLAFEPYAIVQHSFSAWNRSGTYNRTHGVAFTVDEWNDHVRTFVASGAVQAGTIIASGVSAVGALEQLISIGDTINDTAPPPCGDADGDGQVSFADLLAIIAAWGPCPGCAEDLDGDGTVGLSDLLFVLSTWGPC